MIIFAMLCRAVVGADMGRVRNLTHYLGGRSHA